MSTETTTKSHAEFMLEVLKAALDFNSQIVSVATVEVAGDLSGRNRTHQKKVLADIQSLGNSYNYNLNKMFDQREQEMKPEGVGSEFDQETRIAIRKTIAVLDDRMQKNPNKELADVSNYLQLMLDTDEVKVDEAKEVEE